MELLCYYWLKDNRWFFSLPTPNPVKIWALPLVLNVIMLSSALYNLHSTYIANCERDYDNWWIGRIVLLTLLIAGIIGSIYKTIKHKKKQQTKYSNLSPKLLALSNYQHWIKNKSLTTLYGHSIIIIGWLNIFWLIAGLKFLREKNFSFCMSWSKNTMAMHYMISLGCVLPIVFTFLVAFVIKSFSIVIAWYFPRVYIILKRI